MDKILSHKIKLLSFFLIILVVYLHSYTLGGVRFSDHIIFHRTDKLNAFVQQFIPQGLCRTAVPFFFIISGFLFFHNLSKFNSSISFYKYKINSRLRTLLIPYLFWSILGVLIPLSKNFFTRQLITTSLWQNIKLIFITPIPFQLWFIQDLFMLSLISPLIFYSIKYIKYIIFIIVFCNWLFNHRYGSHNEAILFFYVGSFFALHYNINIKFDKKIVFGILVIWLSLLLINTFFIVYGDYLLTVRSQLSDKMLILIGLFSLWYSYDYIPPNKLRIFAGVQGFTFFCTLHMSPYSPFL